MCLCVHFLFTIWCSCTTNLVPFPQNGIFAMGKRHWKVQDNLCLTKCCLTFLQKTGMNAQWIADVVWSPHKQIRVKLNKQVTWKWVLTLYPDTKLLPLIVCFCAEHAKIYCITVIHKLMLWHTSHNNNGECFAGIAWKHKQEFAW